MREVDVRPGGRDSALAEEARYVALALPIARLLQQASAYRGIFQRLRIFCISSTASGGGVAEMMPRLVHLMRDFGASSRWVIIEPEAALADAFFRCTKHLHNSIHGEGPAIDDPLFAPAWLDAGVAKLPPGELEAAVRRFRGEVDDADASESAAGTKPEAASAVGAPEKNSGSVAGTQPGSAQPHDASAASTDSAPGAAGKKDSRAVAAAAARELDPPPSTLEKMRALYEHVNDVEAADFLARFLPDPDPARDIIVIHDPQPMALVTSLRRRCPPRTKLIWRSHIGLDYSNAPTEAACESPVYVVRWRICGSGCHVLQCTAKLHSLLRVCQRLCHSVRATMPLYCLPPSS